MTEDFPAAGVRAVRRPRMMLNELSAALGWEPAAGGDTVAISGITCRPLEVQPGDLYVAMDEYLRYNIWESGRDHVAEAVRRGAVGLVTDAPCADPGVPQIVVSEPRLAFAAAARELYGRPDEELVVVGVTGTNGKTTTSLLTAHLLQACYGETACAGTLGVFRNGQKVEEGEYTTDLMHVTCSRLRRLADSGVRAVSLEVSSHGLALDRVAGLRFAAGILTNITRDHLDFHGTREAYVEAKERLFTGLDANSVAVLNGDDPMAERFAGASGERAVRFSTAGAPEADLRAMEIACSASGCCFRLEAGGRSYRVESPLVGRFQVANILGALGVVYGLGLPMESAIEQVGGFRPVPGRMQAHPLPNGATAIIDFAHNPDGLSNLLENCRRLCRGRVHVVFGCGGDRDRGKRPLMGAAASSLADICWVTSDNPRTEEPMRTITDTLEGIPSSATVHVEADREQAIRAAYAATERGDLLVIAGKGHETYQLIGHKKLPYSDEAVVTSLA